MKTTSIISGLCTIVLTAAIADARPPKKFAKHKHKANKVENKAERVAEREDAIAGDTNRTAILNKEQKKLAARIEAGEKAGKLSKGEASSLRRKLDSLARYEATLKAGDLSENERERLHKKAIEIKRDLHKEIRD